MAIERKRKFLVNECILWPTRDGEYEVEIGAIDAR